VNSENKKPGSPGVSAGELISWEHEWYQVFHGLAFGVSAKIRTQRVWEPLPGPKLRAWLPESKRPRGFEKLDAERVSEWNSKPESQKWQEGEYNDEIPKIPAEPQVWREIKCARSPAEIVKACENSRIWLNPSSHGRPYVVKLKENPVEFLKAKEYRYPRSDRPSSEKKRVLHFARAMAGIMKGIGAVRAIDLIRLRKHGTKCGCVQCEIKNSERLREWLSRFGIA